MDEKKPKVLTELQTKFLAALFGEAQGSLPEAKRIAGYSDYTTVAEVIEPIKDEIISHTQSYLVAHGAKASFKIVNALDERAPNANVLKAAAMVLDRIGVIEKRAQEGVELNIPKGGIFILPAKEAQVFTKVDLGEVVDEAKGE